MGYESEDDDDGVMSWGFEGDEFDGVVGEEAEAEVYASENPQDVTAP